MPFSAGTLIRLSGGTTKTIETISISDLIRGYDATGAVVNNLAVRSITQFAARPVITFRSTTCTKETVFLSNKGFMTLAEIGERGFVYDTGEDPFRVGPTTNGTNAVTYTIEVSGPGTFVAGGWRVRG